MEKELNPAWVSFLGLTWQGMANSANFCQKGWDGRALIGQPSNPRSILILFSITFYYIIWTTNKTIGDLFCSLIFQDFLIVWYKGAIEI